MTRKIGFKFCGIRIKIFLRCQIFKFNFSQNIFEVIKLKIQQLLYILKNK